MRTTPSAFPWPHGAFGRIARYPDFFMARDQIDMTPLQSRDELVTWFEAGVKPTSEFRIGTEHEKTPFTLDGRQPVPYEGARGIGALLEGMKLLLGWEPIMEHGNIIGLYDVTGGGAISLEPGGQFELSGAPVATALFANSPFTEGRPNGYLSFRSEIWRDTDNARSGMIPWAFEDGMGFERWVDYALDVPMYFVKRGEEYIDVSGSSFRDFFEGRNNSLPGERPTLSDWANHLSTIFPEVRLKRYLEMRGADGVPWGRLPALPAFWVGLLYDDESLEAAWDIVKHWNAGERQALRDDVPRFGFKSRMGDRYLLDIAKECLAIAHSGLRRRAHVDHLGRDEGRHLEPLDQIIDSGRTPAEEMLEKFNGGWGGSVEPAYQAYAF